MNKVSISENFIAPSFQTVNKNQQGTELILMDLQSGELFLLHQYYCITSEDYANLIALLQTQAMSDTQCPYILNPVTYLPIRFTNPHFQTSHFVQVLYQYGSHTLQQQLFLRIQQKNFFQQHEIWSILGSCVLGLKSLSDKGFNHSSICMNDIFVNKQGQIKVCHPMFRTYDHNHSTASHSQYIERALQQNYYFSPQQLEQLSNNSNNRQQMRTMVGIDYFKCDIFSLGMVIVGLAMLGPVGECYVRVGIRNSPNNKLAIDTNRLQQYFYILQQSYTQDLLCLLSAMLTFQPEQRISINELAQIIQQMIQAKKNEELLEERNQYPDMSENSFGNIVCDASNSRVFYNGNNNQVSKYNSNTTASKLLHTGNKTHIKSQYESQQMKRSDEQSKSGKFSSRVSQQASPISGRKIKNKCTQQCEKTAMSLLPYEIDNQDRPSPNAFQCSNDIEYTDKPQFQQDNSYMIENQQIQQEQQLSLTQRQQNANNQPNNSQQTTKQIQHQSPFGIKSSSSSPNSIINQTLTHYINQQSESSISQVNQTKTYEEYNKEIEAKKASSPKEIISVMTSKELCSLPDDSISFVNDNKENHLFSSNKLNFAKNINENQNQVNMTVNKNSNDFKQQQTLQHPLSARTLNKKKECSTKKKENNNIKTENNSSFSISLNKDYQSIITLANQNPNAMYTDPKFLQAIRQDVNKILIKRGLNNNQPQTINQQTCNSNNNNSYYIHNKPIFVNGKKVIEHKSNNFSHYHQQQKIYSQYTTQDFHQYKPIFYR